MRKNVTMRHAAAALIGLLATCAITLSGAPCAYAEGRVALVIGNSAYQRLPQLTNPKNDAADVAQAFGRLGFSVTTVQDASFEQLRLALLDFGRAASDADMAVLFYAGHGIEVAGENWLLPVDTDLKRDADVNTEAVTLKRAMLSVANAKVLGLIILDACRNNAFVNVRRSDATRAAERGLAPIDPAENVLVAYAARDGTTARDGMGRNSPFTAALLRHVETPGLELEFLFRNVRDDVWSATNGEQQPFLYGSLSKDEVYFKEPPAPTQSAEAKPAPEETADAGDLTWSFVRTTSDVGTLRRFTEQFPASARTADARVRIAALEAEHKSDAAPIGGGLFTVASESSVRLDEEDLKVARPFRRNSAAVEAAWKVVKDSKDTTVVRRFVDHFPSGRRRAEVENRPVPLVSRLASATPNPDARPLLVTREVVLRAAEDEDVLKCFQLDDIMAVECRRALERYPLISQFTYDYRFRLTLCRALGDACGSRRDVLQNAHGLQGRALFNPANADPAALGGAPSILIAPSYGPGPSGSGAPSGGPSVSPSMTPDALIKPGPTPHGPTPVTGPTTIPIIKPTPHIVKPITGPSGKPVWWKPGTKFSTGGVWKNLNSQGIKTSTQHFKSVPKLNVGSKTLNIKTHHVNVRTLGTANIKTINANTIRNVNVNAAVRNVNVSNAARNVNVTNAVRNVNVNTNVRVTGAAVRVPTVNVKVPTVNVKVPTVRVPTIRVPTVQIGH
jgi:uncharacterized caspase-like protein